jgi:hypothetical protein
LKVIPGNLAYLIGPWIPEKNCINALVADSVSQTEQYTGSSAATKTRYYEYDSRFQSGNWAGHQYLSRWLIISPSILPGNTVIRFLCGGHPIADCLYLGQKNQAVDLKSKQPVDRSNTKLTLVLSHKLQNLGKTSGSCWFNRPLHKTFEDLAKELSEREEQNQTTVASAAQPVASNSTMLFSSSTVSGTVNSITPNLQQGTLIQKCRIPLPW